MQCPLRFWKVVAGSMPRGGLSAFGLMLSQEDVVAAAALALSSASMRLWTAGH